MNHQFYDQADIGDANGMDYADQMDPLNTAAAPIEGEELETAQHDDKSGQEKKPMSLRKKILFGIGGPLLISAIYVVFFVDIGGTPNANPHLVPPVANAAVPTAPPQAPAPASGSQNPPSTNMVSGANQEEPTTLLGNSSDVAKPVMAEQQPTGQLATTTAMTTGTATMPAVPGPVEVAKTGQIAPVTQPVANQIAMPNSKPTANTSPMSSTTAQNPASAVGQANAQVSRESIARSRPVSASSSSSEELVARLDALEKKLARFEHERSVTSHVAMKTPVHPVSRKVKALDSAGASPESSIRMTVQPLAAAGSSKNARVQDSDNMKVIGVATREGVVTALVEFGGIKRRVAVGEMVPGVGPVSNIGIDAGGNPTIEINGVRYQ